MAALLLLPWAAFEGSSCSCVASLEPPAERAVDRIELQQMRRSCRVGRDLVDLNNLDTLLPQPAQTEAGPCARKPLIPTNRHIENPG